MQSFCRLQAPDLHRTHNFSMEDHSNQSPFHTNYTGNYLGPSDGSYYPHVVLDKTYDDFAVRYNTQQDQSASLHEKMLSIQDTLEPHLMLRHQVPVLNEESPIYSPYVPAASIYGYETTPLSALDTSFSSTSHEAYETPDLRFSPSSSDEILSTPRSKCTDEDADNSLDKPYARLIYEALMQAPSHRMMLRDIYEWFIHNTNKPRESGSNGWQNSIRHNLSMNQAFENDRSDISARGHPKKANSVWILTDHAVKHGVQSTTRYRKSGTAKKSSNNRAPATERQKSGSKGGRAARRAAALRSKEQMLRNTAHSDLSSGPSLADPQHLDINTSLSGATLPRNHPFTESMTNYAYTCTNTSPQMPYPLDGPGYVKHDHEKYHDEQRIYDYFSDSYLGEDPRTAYNTNLLHDMFA